MKTVLQSLLIVTVGLWATALRAGVEVGQLAPNFTLTDIDGKTHTLSDYRGRTVVLEWVNPECPFVINHYQNTDSMPKLQKAAKADGVVWLTINSGRPGAQGDFDAAKIGEWMKSTGASPAAYFRDRDGEVGKRYGAKTTPHLYIVAADGTLVYQGAIDSIRSSKPEDVGRAINYVATALAEMKSGKAIATSVSQPYGCAVKY